MIELLPIYQNSLFDEYCLIKGKDQDYKSAVYLTTETVQQEDCNQLLIIGKVQSGKTSHFLGVTLKLFDESYSTTLIFSGTKINLHNQTLERFQKEFRNLNVHIISDNDPEISQKFKPENKNIIICLKHPSRINKLVSLNLDLGKVIVVDDESDQASLNNLNKENLTKQTVKFSETHNSIQILIKLFKPKYIQITATPAGHLLTGMLDYFKPNYLLALKAHSNYFGNHELFNNPNKVIKWIDEDPRSPSKYNLVSFLATHLENSYRLARAREDIKNISAFIHPHSSISINHYYYKITNDIISEMINNSDVFMEKYELYLSDFFKDNCTKIIKKIALKLEITLVAGSHDKGIKWDEYFNQNKFFIFVGGNKLERGITIEGLISTFMPRSQKTGNADTIEQRARFFGSKKDIIEYINIHFNEKTYEDFNEYHKNEEYIFNLTSTPIKSENFTYRFITDYTNPCRENILYNLKRTIGFNWKHFFCPLTSSSFINILETIGVKKSWNYIAAFKSLIYTVNRRDFISQINKLDFLTFPNQLENKLGLVSLLENSNEEDLQIIILGNEIKYRIRTAIVRHNHYIPESVHQSYNDHYPGDGNLVLNNPITLQLSFIELRDILTEPLVTFSLKIKNED